MGIKLVSVCIIFAPLLFFCQSKQGIPDFDIKNTAGKATGDHMRSDAQIDKGNTYEIYFSLKEKEECIKVILISKLLDEAALSQRIAKSFFIVEKSLDVSKFAESANKKKIYFELGRNFDSRWE